VENGVQKRIMTGWYKRAALAGNIEFVIETWLRNCKNAFDSASVHDDITHQMEGADDQATLNVAIQTASNRISAEQGGFLTPSQQELINHIQSRTQNFSDPFAMPNPFGQQQNMQPNQNDGLDVQPMQEPNL